jgi:hypothetical protein
MLIIDIGRVGHTVGTVPQVSPAENSLPLDFHSADADCKQAWAPTQA